eukprot:symbB.v1.2.032091.t1/scaffold3754.1/size70833/2
MLSIVFRSCARACSDVALETLRGWLRPVVAPMSQHTLSQSSLLDGECSHCAFSGTEVHASRDTTAPPSGPWKSGDCLAAFGS